VAVPRLVVCAAGLPRPGAAGSRLSSQAKPGPPYPFLHPAPRLESRLPPVQLPRSPVRLAKKEARNRLRGVPSFASSRLRRKTGPYQLHCAWWFP